MIIENEDVAKQILLDIGYYRLGFYWFPFEIQPSNKREERTHSFAKGTTFNTVVQLFELDTKLRTILFPHLLHIETNFRTKIVYTLSNHFSASPAWFADKRCVKADFVDGFDKIFDVIRKKHVIKQHAQRHPNDKYPPAWKTLEYLTFGQLITLYSSVLKHELRAKIASIYGIENYDLFLDLLMVLLYTRNNCAHGDVLFDMQLAKPFKAKAILGINAKTNRNISGAILLIYHFLSTIDKQEADSFLANIKSLLDKYAHLKDIAKNLFVSDFAI